MQIKRSILDLAEIRKYLVEREQPYQLVYNFWKYDWVWAKVSWWRKPVLGIIISSNLKIFSNPSAQFFVLTTIGFYTVGIKKLCPASIQDLYNAV